MLLIKAKNCDRCKALNDGQGHTSFHCELGYDNINPDRERGYPQERCPKPLTNKELINAVPREMLNR